MNKKFRSEKLCPGQGKRRFFLFLITGLLFSFVGGCSSSPPPRLYGLGTVLPPAEAKNSSLPILYVAPPFMPRYLDRPQIVLRKGERELILDDKHRWAAPLGDLISEQISASLNARLTSFRVLSGDRALLHPAPALRLDIQILDFTSDENGNTQLSGTYLLWNKEGDEREIPFTIHTEFRGGSVEERVVSLGNALDLLCDEIGDMLSASGPDNRKHRGNTD